MEITIGLVLISLLCAMAFWSGRRRIKRIANERGDPDICRFVRSFDYRNVDTKIIREVWTELKMHLGKYNGNSFPVQSDDKFSQTYQMDMDDLEDIYLDIAKRLGISIVNPQDNPLWNKIETVEDLVMFLHYQQKTAKENLCP